MNWKALAIIAIIVFLLQAGLFILNYYLDGTVNLIVLSQVILWGLWGSFSTYKWITQYN